MKKLTDEIAKFLHDQGFVVVSTLDKNKAIHSSCKGIVKISKAGSIYLLDLYVGETFNNLRLLPNITITAVDEHKFKGYCLKGKAKLVEASRLKPHLIKEWEDRLTSRITQRVIKNMRDEKGHPRHPEALLPGPAYLIVMRVDEIVDLTPHRLK